MAGSVNKVILIGNLGADPEVRRLESGATVAQFRIATTETYRDRTTQEKRSQTEWHNIVLWRGLAEIAEKYLRKGSTVYIEGKLQSRSWETKEGEMRYITEVVGNEMTMLDKRPQNDSSSSPAPAAQQPIQSPKDDEADDLPF